MPAALLLVEGPRQPHYLKSHGPGCLPQPHPGSKAWLVWQSMAGMAWYGLAWHGKGMAGRARAWLVWHGHGWYGKAWLVWHGMACHAMRHARPDQPWHGMVWYGMVWYGMVWYASTGSEVPAAFLLGEGSWQPHYLKLHGPGCLPQPHPGSEAWLVWQSMDGMVRPGMARPWLVGHGHGW